MPNYAQHPGIRRLFSKGQPVTFGKGDIILGNEPQPNGLYYISTGYVKIYSVSDSGDQYIHIIYGPGDIFPLIWAYLDIQPQALFYEALSEAVTWRLSREWFSTFVNSNLELSHAMAQQLARQFRVYADRVDNLEYKKASERVIYRILFLASRFGIRERDNSVTILAPLTHETLANTINLARESVSRELERLERQGLIQQQGHSIQLLDVTKLSLRLSRPVSLSNWNLL